MFMSANSKLQCHSNGKNNNLAVEKIIEKIILCPTL
jgi:hypothetical protein